MDLLPCSASRGQDMEERWISVHSSAGIYCSSTTILLAETHPFMNPLYTWCTKSHLAGLLNPDNSHVTVFHACVVVTDE